MDRDCPDGPVGGVDSPEPRRSNCCSNDRYRSRRRGGLGFFLSRRVSTSSGGVGAYAREGTGCLELESRSSTTAGLRRAHVNVNRALEYVRGRKRGVLVTVRRDGRPQLSNVAYGVAEDGVIRVSVTDDRAKTKN